MAKVHFDISTYEAPKSDYDPLPKGEYMAMVTESQMKITKAGTGEYLALTMQIIEGKYADRKIWENLNLHNPNEVAENIARANLKAVSEACGFAELDDTDQLNDIPFILVLDIDRKDPTRNRVMGYKRAGSSAAPSSFAQTSATAAKPWERK
jgi:hypothetical protein